MKYTAKIRYSDLLCLDDFITEEENLLPGTLCVVHTERGIEVGSVVMPPRLVEESEKLDEQKFILRLINEEDLKKIEEIKKEEREEYEFARSRIKERTMEMKLSKVDHLFGGEKIIFYFLAEGRVDFRVLVRDLAKQYKTRIEMRQVGARDEARLLGDVGHCGEQLCCSRFLKDFNPITMKMAKNQKASLDPKKISGACGKLLCCLKYEDDQYIEALSTLPEAGAVIKTKEGVGEVLSLDAMKGTVSVKIEAKGRVEVFKKDIYSQVSPASNADSKSGKSKKKKKK